MRLQLSERCGIHLEPKRYCRFAYRLTVYHAPRTQIRRCYCCKRWGTIACSQRHRYLPCILQSRTITFLQGTLTRRASTLRPELSAMQSSPVLKKHFSISFKKLGMSSQQLWPRIVGCISVDWYERPRGRHCFQKEEVTSAAQDIFCGAAISNSHGIYRHPSDGTLGLCQLDLVFH